MSSDQSFGRNRHLLHDLPKLGAAVIQQWVKLKDGCSRADYPPSSYGDLFPPSDGVLALSRHSQIAVLFTASNRTTSTRKNRPERL